MALLIAACSSQGGSAGAPPADLSRISPAPTSRPQSELLNRDAPAYSGNQNALTRSDRPAGPSFRWRAAPPAYLAYDLSAVPASRRAKVLVFWYDDLTGPYDYTVLNSVPYNEPRDYTIDLNPAAGGRVPDGGWTTVETVRSNLLHSRQHLVTMAGYNWIRIRVTAANGSPQNEDAALSLELFNAEAAVGDDWIFMGDSITDEAMAHLPWPGVADLVAAGGGRYPVLENAGIPFLRSADGVAHLQAWLDLFPGHYVGLAYGTNDASAGVDPATFLSNYRLMVDAVLRAGKVPVVPSVPWGCTQAIQSFAPKYNTVLKQLYANSPLIVQGPDLWSHFEANRSLLSKDCIHPSPDGYLAYRQLYAALVKKTPPAPG